MSLTKEAIDAVYGRAGAIMDVLHSLAERTGIDPSTTWNDREGAQKAVEEALA